MAPRYHGANFRNPADTEGLRIFWLGLNGLVVVSNGSSTPFSKITQDLLSHPTSPLSQGQHTLPLSHHEHLSTSSVIVGFCIVRPEFDGLSAVSNHPPIVLKGQFHNTLL